MRSVVSASRFRRPAPSAEQLVSKSPTGLPLNSDHLRTTRPLSERLSSSKATGEGDRPVVVISSGCSSRRNILTWSHSFSSVASFSAVQRLRSSRAPSLFHAAICCSTRSQPEQPLPYISDRLESKEVAITSAPYHH